MLDTGNPYPERDGEMAHEARRKGTGVASAECLPGVRLDHSCALLADGGIRCWGANGRGQLGIGAPSSSSQAPAYVSGR